MSKGKGHWTLTHCKVWKTFATTRLMLIITCWQFLFLFTNEIKCKSTTASSSLLVNNNNNNRKLMEHFQKLKAIYNLRKNIQYANTHNDTNQWYINIQNKKINKHFHPKHGKNTCIQDHAHTYKYTSHTLFLSSQLIQLFIPSHQLSHQELAIRVCCSQRLPKFFP